MFIKVNVSFNFLPSFFSTLFIPLFLQVGLFVLIFWQGVTSVGSWQLLTVFYYFLPLFFLSNNTSNGFYHTGSPPANLLDAHLPAPCHSSACPLTTLLSNQKYFWQRCFDFLVLSLLFLLSIKQLSSVLTAVIFFGVLGACRTEKNSFFLRLLARRIQLLPTIFFGSHAIFCGFLSLFLFNTVVPVDVNSNIWQILISALLCSLPVSVVIYFDHIIFLRLQNNQSQLSAKNMTDIKLDSSYQEVLDKFTVLSDKIIAYATTQKNHNLIYFIRDLQNTCLELLIRGNELFVFLRETSLEVNTAIALTATTSTVLKEKTNNTHDELLNEKTEILRQKEILLTELASEEKKLWITLENILLRLDNLYLLLVGKAGALSDSGLEIQNLNQSMEEIILFFDEKRKAMKSLLEG